MPISAAGIVTDSTSIMLEVVRRHVGEGDHRRHRRRHRAARQGDADPRRSSTAVAPDGSSPVRHVVDHREQRVDDVAGAGAEAEHERHQRCDQGHLLGVAADGVGRHGHHPVDASGHLHRGGGEDHREDDQDRVDRRRARVQAEAEDQDGDADAAPDAEGHAARLGAHHDGADDHQGLDREQQPVHVFSFPCRLSFCRVRCSCAVGSVNTTERSLLARQRHVRDLDGVLDERGPRVVLGVGLDRGERAHQVVERLLQGVELGGVPTVGDLLEKRSHAAAAHRPDR